MIEMEEEKRYYVNFYDAIDGWINVRNVPGFWPDRMFDDLEEAKTKCKELMEEFKESYIDNVRMGEHY